MCSRDFATVGAEMPMLRAVAGIDTMGLRRRCSNTRSAFEQALEGLQTHRRIRRERRRHGHKILSLANPSRKDMPFSFR